MKKILLLICLFLLSSLYLVRAQQINDTKKMTQDLYEKAQHSLDPMDKIKYSNQALMTIMAQTDDTYLIAHSGIIIPILKFNAEACVSYLSTSIRLDEDTKDGLLYSIERDTQTLFYFIKINNNIEFLWGSLTVEDVFYITGRAKYYAGLPYKDDLAKAGQKGINFLKQQQSHSDDDIQEEYLTYYNERFGYYITYPSYLYIQGESQNNDGKTFFSNNATIKLSVGAHLIVLNETIADDANMTRQDLTARGYSITYSFVKDSKIIYSGYTSSGNIYYQKSVRLYSPTYEEEIVATAYVEYPSAEKRQGDEIIKLLNKFPYK